MQMKVTYIKVRLVCEDQLKLSERHWINLLIYSFKNALCTFQSIWFFLVSHA